VFTTAVTVTGLEAAGQLVTRATQLLMLLVLVTRTLVTPQQQQLAAHELVVDTGGACLDKPQHPG
jgi:hypothetical protein